MRASFKYSYKGVVIVSALFCQVFSACSHVGTEPVTDSANLASEISLLESEKKQSEALQINLLSPTYFEKMESSLAEAKKKRADRADRKSVLQQLGLARTYLKKAILASADAQSFIPEVIEARNAAIASQSNLYFPQDLEKIDRSLKEVTARLEAGKKAPSEDKKSDLKNSYLNLELKTVKYVSLGASWQLIGQAKRENAEMLAPKTLAQTEAMVARLDSEITLDRNNKRIITQLSYDTYRQAQKLVKMTRDVTIANLRNNGNSEDFLIQIESLAKRADLGERSHRESLATIAFKNRLDSVQSQFTSNEADVYSLKNKVLIRLKDLNFPVGKDYIVSENYPIMYKVQKVIQALNPRHVVIEGHSDSVGGFDFNQRISEQRALSVKKYLVSNEIIPEARITAIGSAYNKPLANDKSETGRSLNRRVDILIEPNAVSSSKI